MCRTLERLRVAERIAHELHDTETQLASVRGELGEAKKQLAETLKLVPSEDKASSGTQNPSKYFVGLGTASNIPMYLRFTGQVRNRNISKADLETLVKTIWREKAIKEQEYGIQYRLSEFFYDYLKNTFGIQTIIAEWGYNILYGLEKYVWDADIELFLLCLTGAISEEVYDDQMLMISALATLLEQIDASYTKSKKDGRLQGSVRKTVSIPEPGVQGSPRKSD